MMYLQYEKCIAAALALSLFSFGQPAHAEENSNDKSANNRDWDYTMSMLDIANPEDDQRYIDPAELKAGHVSALEHYGELKLQANDLEGAKKYAERLEEVCPYGCDELETLKKSISEFEEQHK
ncbi:hypothetical protein ACXJY6_11935 [Vibrio sp. RC27]